MEENKDKINLESIFKEKIFTVSEFLDFLNDILTSQKFIVQGEIGNKIDDRLTYYTFNLLDKTNHNVLKCFVWKSNLRNLNVELKEGMEIKVFGSPKIYKSAYGSTFEFEVDVIYLIGEGLLKEAFEATKRKLEKEGLFSIENKKSIPKFCEKIGLITSKYGKGAKPDFEKNLKKFGFKVYFYDVRVEGISAISQIKDAIYWFNENKPELDALVLIRCGGDWESLQAFNAEEVVRSIAASRIPIICGIGHESDTTLADLAADFRASTPTEVAKILSENWELANSNISNFENNFVINLKRIFKNTEEKLNFIEKDLIRKINEEIIKKQKNLEYVKANLNLNFQNYFKEFNILEKEFKQNFRYVFNLLKEKKEAINYLQENLNHLVLQWEKQIKKDLAQKEINLVQSSPVLKLKQGYTITRDEFGKIINKSQKLKIDQVIKTQFYKGQIISKIKKINK